MSTLTGRPLALGAAVLFVVSSAFPVVAGLAEDTASFPRWWGVADVAIAFVLAMLAFVLAGLWDRRVDRRAEELSYRSYRVLIHGIMAMLVVFVLMGDRVSWTNCLSGFAWRAWLLLYMLPCWFAALTSRSGGSTGGVRA